MRIRGKVLCSNTASYLSLLDGIYRKCLKQKIEKKNSYSSAIFSFLKNEFKGKKLNWFLIKPEKS